MDISIPNVDLGIAIPELAEIYALILHDEVFFNTNGSLKLGVRDLFEYLKEHDTFVIIVGNGAKRQLLDEVTSKKNVRCLWDNDLASLLTKLSDSYKGIKGLLMAVMSDFESQKLAKKLNFNPVLGGCNDPEIFRELKVAWGGTVIPLY